MATKTCVTPNCGKNASFLCPICNNYGLKTYFCDKTCFQGFWKQHKPIHDHLAQSVSERACNINLDELQNFNFTGSLRPAEKTPMRKVPKSIDRPDYSESGIAHSERRGRNPNEIKCLDAEEIQAMRLTCKHARDVLNIAINTAKLGVTTDEIDRVVHEACIERDCYPSPLNYFYFPKSCCTSLNEIICHGIPDKRPLEEVDITTYHGGYHGDLNETIFIGKPSTEDIKLVKCAYDCLAYAMDEVKPNFPYRNFGAYISKRASKDNFSVVRTYCGHGIHKLFHCNPNVPHYTNNKAVGTVQPGHCFTIEPMINAGDWKDVTWPDKWTSSTTDGKKSAQFEHTMVACNERPSSEIDEDKMPYIETLTKRECDTRVDLAEAICNLNIYDQRHFEWYGRPHFIDQLFEYGVDFKDLFYDCEIN